MSTWDDMDRTALAPRVDDVTEAWAWASSPLGDPTDESGDRPSGREFSPNPLTPPQPRSIDKLWVTAGVVGLIGAGVALGITFLSSSPQPRSVAVTSGSTAVPAALPASAAPAPAAAVVPPPDNGPAQAPVDATPGAPAPVAVVAPPPDNPAPAPDPGAPPAAAPQGPVVVVNAPAPVPVWVPAPPPQLPPPPSLPPLPAPPKLPPLPAPPKLPPPPPPPALCLPPHHLVQGVCK